MRALTPEVIRYGLIVCIFAVAAHAIAYMTHEYSHSFIAWALGWMTDPLALDYGQPTLYNFLFLGDVGDNVDYAPIFSSGHGLQAAIIALAGTVIGNGVLYFLLYRLAKIDTIASSRLGLSFVYFLAVMCAGNVWGYVPIRAITTHADIALAAQGLGISTWVLFPFVIVPALYTVWHFFGRMVPLCLDRMTGGSIANLTLVIVLTGYWFFAFFGGDGTDGGYGLVSQFMAIGSKYFLFPLSVLYLTAIHSPAASSGLARPG